MKKRLFVKIFSIILVVCTICIFTACNEPDDNAPSVTPTPVEHPTALTPKVILFIGDGMGPNHVYNTELYYDTQMCFSSFSFKTVMDTNSLSGVTDSAASATAMATGVRVLNGKIGIDDNEKSLTSITELAKENFYGAGVVTSDEITGATPAGFSAHAESRSNSAEILLSQENSPIDLLLGSGSYSSVYESRFADKGFTWVKSLDQLTTEYKRFVATFSDVNYENGTNAEPTLTQLATYAIDYMETNYPTGYFLMIEGAKIDKESHSNDIAEMMKNQLDFNSAISAVDSKLQGQSYGYSLIVTADHETGGLGKANSKAEVTDALYTTTGHTDEKVDLFFKSTLTTAPEILSKDNFLNSDIFLLCKQLLAIA